MNPPEPLILEALQLPLHDNVRSIAIDFLSGDRSRELADRTFVESEFLFAITRSGSRFSPLESVSYSVLDVVYGHCGGLPESHPNYLLDSVKALKSALKAYELPRTLDP